MNTKLAVTLLTLVIISCVDSKRSISLSTRGSSSNTRGTVRRTRHPPKPAPASINYPQPTNRELFGWQEKTGSKPQNIQTGGHSYPSSQTGLSGNNQAKLPATNHDSIQRSSATHNLNGQQKGSSVQSQTNSQSGHSYPASGGLSGSHGSGYPQQTGSGISHQQGSSYPQQPGSGLSGSGVSPLNAGAAAPPPYPGYKPADSNRPSSYNGATYQSNNYGNNHQHPQQPPPPYTNYGSNYGGHGGPPAYHTSNGPQISGYGSQSLGYFGNHANYGNRGGMSRSRSALTGIGIAGAGVGTILTGLALWNLARSTGNRHHTVIYDNRGQPVGVAPDNNNDQLEVNSMLADLVNCSLTISNDDKTEVLAIPCAIATSFTSDADVKTLDNEDNADNTKCTVTVVKKSGKEFMTTIPCSILLKSAAENNVTEPPVNVNDNVNISYNANSTMIIPTATPILDPNQPSSLSLTSSEVDQNNSTMNITCVPPLGETGDPINSCSPPVTHNLTINPLQTTENNESIE